MITLFLLGHFYREAKVRLAEKGEGGGGNYFSLSLYWIDFFLSYFSLTRFFFGASYTDGDAVTPPVGAEAGTDNQLAVTPQPLYSRCYVYTHQKCISKKSVCH